MKRQHQALKDFVHSHRFCHLVNYVIILFAVFIGIETQVTSPEVAVWFDRIEWLFMIFFIVEIVLRIIAEDHPLHFFNLFKRRRRIVMGRKKTELEIEEHGVWNYFDFILVVMSIIGLFANVFATPGILQVGRLFRIFRIVRLLEVSDHLKEVEKRIVSIVPTVFSFAALLLILTYIYSIMGMFMFERKIYESANFSSITESFITLFQVMTLDNWSDVMKDLSAHVTSFHPIFIQVYFISFVIFTSIIAFNVFVAVMTSQVQEKLEKDFAQRLDDVAENRATGGQATEIQALAEEVKKLRLELAAWKSEKK